MKPTLLSLWTILAPILLPIIIGVLTRYIMAGFKRASGVIDALDPKYQQAIVVVIATTLTALGNYMGVDLCGGQDCTSLASVTSPGLTAFLASAFAMVTHNGKKLSAVTNGDDRPGAPIAPTSVKVSDSMPPEKFGE